MAKTRGSGRLAAVAGFAAWEDFVEKSAPSWSDVILTFWLFVPLTGLEKCPTRLHCMKPQLSLGANECWSARLACQNWDPKRKNLGTFRKGSTIGLADIVKRVSGLEA